jgi:hypothetical protein
LLTMLKYCEGRPCFHCFCFHCSCFKIETMRSNLSICPIAPSPPSHSKGQQFAHAY